MSIRSHLLDQFHTLLWLIPAPPQKRIRGDPGPMDSGSAMYEDPLRILSDVTEHIFEVFFEAPLYLLILQKRLICALQRHMHVLHPESLAGFGHVLGHFADLLTRYDHCDAKHLFEQPYLVVRGPVPQGQL